MHGQADYWHEDADGRVCCELCPRECRLNDGQRGFCFVRQNEQGRLALTTYGRSSGFCIDPVEKKPLNHFLPGTPILSFGTAGCNLACRFCQNAELSASRNMDRLAERAQPDEIAAAARRYACRSVAFTYNDPVIFAEYAMDIAHACRQQDVRTVAVTAGYIQGRARRDFFACMDAANVDLKAFSDGFYRQFCGVRLQPVLDTLMYLRAETDIWLELTTLVIPGVNDSPDELNRMTCWIVDNLGVDTPIHFTAFHPAHQLTQPPPTSPQILRTARKIARENGLRYVYIGNIHEQEGNSTRCAHCDKILIERNGYTLGEWNLDHLGCCRFCGTRCAGVFDPEPGVWGARCVPVRIR